MGANATLSVWRGVRVPLEQKRRGGGFLALQLRVAVFSEPRARTTDPSPTPHTLATE